MLRIRSGTRVRLTDNGNGNGNAAVAAAVAVGDAQAPGAESRELASPPASEPGAPWLAGSSHPAGGEPQSEGTGWNGAKAFKRSVQMDDLSAG